MAQDRRRSEEDERRANYILMGVVAGLLLLTVVVVAVASLNFHTGTTAPRETPANSLDGQAHLVGEEVARNEVAG